MSDNDQVPGWVIGVLLMLGGATVFLLSFQGRIAPYYLSWPLLVSLVGFALLIANAMKFLAFGGVLLAAGIFGYLHNTNRLPLGTNWPWLVVVLAVLVTIDRLVARGHTDRASS